ncbi:putative two-component response regulator [Aquipseudomonas alcaligenes]|nr:putative two-component response regulator [Pseudomonas alcaligenes]
MLTARDQLDDRLQGFQSGADDYLVKPFALSELAARIEAVLRRSLGGGKRQLQVSDLIYDLDTLEATRADKPLKGWSEVVVYFWLTSAPADFKSGKSIKNAQITRLFLCF